MPKSKYLFVDILLGSDIGAGGKNGGKTSAYIVIV